MRQSPQRTIEWAIEQYVLSRTGRRPISARDAIRALRTLMPKCALSARELTDLIAISAVRRHLDVIFDGNPDESVVLRNGTGLQQDYRAEQTSPL